MEKHKALGSNPLERLKQMEEEEAPEPAPETDEPPATSSALDQLMGEAAARRVSEGAADAPQYQGLFGLILVAITVLLLILGYMGYSDLLKRIDGLTTRVQVAESRLDAMSGRSLGQGFAPQE